MQIESHQGLKSRRRAEMEYLHVNAEDGSIPLDISLFTKFPSVRDEIISAMQNE